MLKKAQLKPLSFFFILCVSSAVADVYGISENILDYINRNYGQDAKARLIDWRDLIQNEKYKSLPEPEKLKLVNDFFNQVRFVDDIEHWKKEDYWATPIEMLSTNGGDCEDFSIGKYFTLKALNVPIDRLKLTYVKSILLGQAHMVLAYYSSPGAEPLILDNLMDEIRPASVRTDLIPVYSFNGDGLWLSKERGEGKRVGKSSRLGLWNELSSRMKKEQNQK
ncbi:MAG: transglutaminase-like cysteine peptidase [Gammaproteobacteria bacterium]|nr:transglutaminase-like cysteine peptidase [Gammaproteobacteria bacterium]